MNRKFPHLIRRHGTTLIEVLAGLVILGTLLVSLAIARGRFLRQWAEADHRLAAAHETNHLLETWLSGSPRTVPISSSGVCDDGKLVWSTQVIPSPAAASVGAVVVRLEVSNRAGEQKPLCGVDFLLQDPRTLTRDETAGVR